MRAVSGLRLAWLVACGKRQSLIATRSAVYTRKLESRSYSCVDFLAIRNYSAPAGV